MADAEPDGTCGIACVEVVEEATCGVGERGGNGLESDMAHRAGWHMRHCWC